MKIAATTPSTAIARICRTKTHSLITVSAILALAAPTAATAETLRATRPPTHVGAKKALPSKGSAKRGSEQKATPRRLCICIVLQIDRATVQAQADYEARFRDWMAERGIEPWDWGDDPVAVAAYNDRFAAFVAGARTIDEILPEVRSTQ